MTTHLHRGSFGGLACGLWLALVPPAAAELFVVTEPWVRLAPDGRSAEGYMELRSSEGATLVAVRTDAASRVAMHPPGPARAPVAAIALPARTSVMLAPNGPRIALQRLARTLRLGDRVAFVLTIEAADGTRQEIPVNAEVRRRSPTDDHKRAHAHSS